MKQSLILRVGAFLLACTLLLVISLPVYANASPEEIPLALEWTMSEDYTTLSNGEETYRHFPLPSGYEWKPMESYYLYADSLLTVENTEKTQAAALYAPYHGSDLVYVVFIGSLREAQLYVTEAGYERIRSFANGGFRVCQMVRTVELVDYVAPLDSALVQAFIDAEPTDTIDVRLLRDKQVYHIYGYDECGVVCSALGAFYRMGTDSYCFVDYSALDNTCFDSEGAFSYRKGTVPIVELKSGELYEAFLKLREELVQSHVSLSFEPRPGGTEDAAFLAFAFPVFWIFYAVIGFIVPILLLWLALRLIHSNAHAKQKRWHLLMVLAGLWFLCALGILICLLW